MMCLGGFNAIAASRGDGLHPKLRELLERTAASSRPGVTMRPDGMLQAGPNPRSEEGESQLAELVELQRLFAARPR